MEQGTDAFWSRDVTCPCGVVFHFKVLASRSTGGKPHRTIKCDICGSSQDILFEGEPTLTGCDLPHKGTNSESVG